MRASWRPGMGPLLRGLRSLGVVAATLLAVASGIGNAAAATADPPSCRVVRLADVGWTAETATTAVLAQMLADLGYKPVITVLSVPVTLESMKNGDIDVFLGNWMPAQESMLKPYTDEGSVEVVRAQPRRREVHAWRARLSVRRGAEGLRGHQSIQKRAGGIDLRHRARQRRQSPHPRPDQEERVRPRRLQAGRVERAGHARAGRTGLPVPAARRVPGVGPASDEHALQRALPHGWRRDLRPGFRRGHGQHAGAQGLPAGMPQRCTVARRTSSSRSNSRTSGWTAS